MTRDRWFLTGAWAAIAAVGALSIYKGARTPELDPGIARLCREVAALEQVSPGRYPAPSRLPFVDPVYAPPEGRPVPKGGDLFRTVAVGHPVEPPDIGAKVLPFPVLQSIKADLDGIVVQWTTEHPPVTLLRKMTPVPVEPRTVSVFRQHEDETPEKVADLAPKSRSWTDLSAKPGWTYRYWVALTGLETVRSDRSGALVEVTNRSDRSLTATAPWATRVKLIGGDRAHAFMRVETYDRAKKAWVGKAPVQTAPGEKVDGTGWQLKGLRFENFTLVADMTDDDGAVQVLSTRN